MRKLFGGLLLAVGILIMTGSGLCSLVVLITMMDPSFQMAPLVMIIGGLPFLMGLGLFMAGRRLLKRHRQLSLDDLHDRFE